MLKRNRVKESPLKLPDHGARNEAEGILHGFGAWIKN
jgi:hypothetical protein